MKIKTILLGTIFMSIVGCTNSGSNGASGPESNSSQNFSFFSMLSVANASSEQCPAGGKVYSLFIDANLNGHEDENEAPLSQQIVCNGINGSQGVQGENGYNALISTNRADTDACPAGAGLQISYGLDSDRSNVLEAEEITKTDLLCDGQNGEVGAQGPAGANGHSIVFASVSAPPQVCPAGGVTTLMALDDHDLGVYSALDSSQSSMTICNGQNGQNGQDGQDGQNAVVGAYTPVDAIFPCGNNTFAKEVLLRLNNGQVLASFSDKANGQNTRLAFLADGTYQDTDGTSCTFSISTSNKTRSISWGGHVQSSWLMP